MDPVIYVAMGLAHVEGALGHFRAGWTGDAVRDILIGMGYISLAVVKAVPLLSIAAD